ncbi:MAG TPA: serine/threonine-protein kinase [Pirellulales bacterium]|nr:serine/threonine-protein kinase [Pirellulales bacterium]
MTQTTEPKLLLASDGPRRTSASHETAEYPRAVAAALPTEAGDWRLEGLLGEGALARVFRARPAASPAGHRAAYALKMLHRRWEEQSEAVALLRREAKVGRTVVHPHVIPVLAAHLHDAPYFVVMPRLVGQTLAARLRGGPLNASTALWIARQTAEGLSAMHRHGYLHGDVKPANIFLARNGHLTLLDLGFARAFGETGSAANRLVLGTINYLAPELLTSALAADERTDIFSLGIVLFEMLAGRLPLAARDLADLLRMHNEYRPPNLRALRPDLPPELAHLVRRMLFKEPLRRPQSMQEVIHQLVRLEIDALDERAA